MGEYGPLKGGTWSNKARNRDTVGPWIVRRTYCARKIWEKIPCSLRDERESQGRLWENRKIQVIGSWPGSGLPDFEPQVGECSSPPHTPFACMIQYYNTNSI